MAVAKRPSNPRSSITWFTRESTVAGLDASRAYANVVARRKPVSVAAAAPFPHTSPTISQQLSGDPKTS